MASMNSDIRVRGRNNGLVAGLIIGAATLALLVSAGVSLLPFTASAHGVGSTLNFAATPLSATSIKLSWTSTSDTSNSSIDQHDLTIWYCHGVGCTPTTLLYSHTNNFLSIYSGSFNHTGLITGGTYGYKIEERHGGYVVEQILTNIVVVTPNSAPVAAAKSITTLEDTATSSAVHATDSDIPAQTITYTIISGPAHGTVTGLPNTTGAFTYTPAADYNGTDSFLYKASDGTASSTATVSIAVTPVNDAPSFTKGADQNVAEDSLLQTIVGWATAILAGPANESAQTVAFTVTNGNNALFSVQPSVSANGTLTFTSALNQSGSALVTLFLKDNAGTLNGGIDTSASQTFTISIGAVNDAPVALDDSASTNEDTLVVTDNVLANDTDIEGDTLTVSAFDATSMHGGTVTSNNDGTFNFTPALNFNGTDTFNYTVSDGSLTDIGTVTITVSNANDAPVAVADSYSVAEDATLTVAAPGVLSNDTDTDVGDTLTASLVSGAAHGTVTLVSDGSFTYAPVADFNGTDSFTYHAVDTALAISGDVTVTITVTPTNDAPVAVSQAVSTVANTNLSGTVTATDIDVPADTLTFSTTSNPTNGTLVFNTDGTFTYTPATGFVGSDEFTFKANDGTTDSNVATTTITVTATPVENTQALCTDGIDNDNDGQTDSADTDCAAFQQQNTGNTGNGGGNGGGGGGGVVSGPLSIGFVTTNNGGQVLGTSTEALPEGCSIYLNTYLKQGNTGGEVKKLQSFLNSYMNAGLPVSGVFGPLTFKAVQGFQLKHADDVLAPWLPFGLANDHTATGYVFKTTKYKINLIQCSTLNLPKPQLP